MPAKKSNGVVYLSQGKYQGRATWHYLQVDRLKIPLLIEAVKKSSEIDLAHYGKVLFCGWGEQPPKMVAAHVDQYYIRHES